MLGRILRLISEKVFGPVGRVIARTPITANSITITGAVITAVACWYIASGEARFGGLVLILGSLFDTLDGPVAKARGSSGKPGAFLDSTLDRLSDGLIFGAIAWYLAFSAEHQTGTALALACMILGFLTSYIKARAEGLGFEANVGIAERALRLIVVLAGLVFDVLIAALGALVLLSLVTVLQRFFHVWRQARANIQAGT